METQRRTRKRFTAGLTLVGLSGLCGLSASFAASDLMQGENVMISGLTTVVGLGLTLLLGSSVNDSRREQFKITNTPTS